MYGVMTVMTVMRMMNICKTQQNNIVTIVAFSSKERKSMPFTFEKELVLWCGIWDGEDSKPEDISTALE